MKRSCLLVLFPVALTTAGFSMTGQASEHHRPNTTITMKQARAIAKHTCHGTIENVELEHENGGSGLRYSFDMHRHGKWREVGVDANTGKILENRPESANPKD